MHIDILFQEFVRQGTFLRSLSPRTAAIYRVAYSRLRGCLAARKEGTFELPDLTKANLDAWVCQMRNDGLTPGGSNVNIRSINSFLSWLSTEGHLSSPIKMRTLPRRTEALPIFSDAEIRTLLSHRPRGIYETRAWVLVLTLLDTGRAHSSNNSTMSIGSALRTKVGPKLVSGAPALLTLEEAITPGGVDLSGEGPAR